MLSHQKKAAILVKTGTVVPPFPTLPSSGRTGISGQGADRPVDGWDPEVEQAHAVAAWNRIIDGLFVNYAAARAAKSLRDSERVSQLEGLRRANGGAHSASR